MSTIRGFHWRYSVEMAAAMLAPAGLIVAVSQLAGYSDLAWLTYADYPIMSVGMAAAIIFSRHEETHRTQNAMVAEPSWVTQRNTSCE